MSWAVFKQPDDTYAVWSTVSDDWVMIDAAEAEVVQELSARCGAHAADLLMEWGRDESSRLPGFYPEPTHQPGEPKP